MTPTSVGRVLYAVRCWLLGWASAMFVIAISAYSIEAPPYLAPVRWWWMVTVGAMVAYAVVHFLYVRWRARWNATRPLEHQGRLLGAYREETARLWGCVNEPSELPVALEHLDRQSALYDKAEAARARRLELEKEKP